MIRTALFILTALGVLGTTAAAQTAKLALNAEPERPSLRAEATVTGDIVRIGDLIDHAGIVADVPIFRAPPLGQTGVVTTAQVLDAVRAHALVGLDPGGVTQVAVTRASRAIAVREIEMLLARALAKNYSLGDAADIAVNFDRALGTIQLEPSITAAPQIEALRYDAGSARFDATLVIAGAPGGRRRLSGSAISTSEVVTLARPLARGEIIKMSDVTLQRVARTQVNADAITDPDRVIGLALRNATPAGRILRSSEVVKPEIVQRNDSVTIVYQVPGIVLAVRGKALDSGAEGDLIEVLNVQSNRAVRGTIVGPGQVAVMSMAARVIAAAEAASAGDADGAK